MPKPAAEPKYRPIIYVRGFAGSGSEIDDTVADPYMGFNVGATKFRQGWKGPIRRHYFEGPLYRLVKEHEYEDVYTDGTYMPPGEPVSPRSVVVYRYYDEEFFEDVRGGGDPNAVSGKAREIVEFARGLGELILAVRDRVCDGDEEAEAAFKVHLVGHSMGGLVMRAFLQNRETGSAEARGLVDKAFTYGTPHNGIEFALLGNVPGFFTANDVDNFDRDKMREYLALPAWTKTEDRVDNLAGAFDPDRFFCLVGTNHQDYAVAYGWSRRLVGPASDGLVRIKNAAVHSRAKKSEPRRQAPRAFVNRAHSGHFGIVNSEEGYQNLTRFLFGDVRVDGVLEVDELTLPEPVAEAKEVGAEVRASYNFECVVRTRGARYDLHRRTAAEGSAVFRRFDDLFPEGRAARPRHPHLFSVFLSKAVRVKKLNGNRVRSLGFAVTVAARATEYEVDRRFWFDRHYEGGELFRETLILEAVPDDDAPGGYRLKYGLQSKTPGRAGRRVDGKDADGGVEFRIPLKSGTRPGFAGTLRLLAKNWK